MIDENCNMEIVPTSTRSNEDSGLLPKTMTVRIRVHAWSGGHWIVFCPIPTTLTADSMNRHFCQN